MDQLKHFPTLWKNFQQDGYENNVSNDNLSKSFVDSIGHDPNICAIPIGPLKFLDGSISPRNAYKKIKLFTGI